MGRVCATCNNDHEELRVRGVVPKHPFNDGSVPTSVTFGSRRSDGTRQPPETPQRPSQAVQWVRHPFDPVLRMALINKGILTIDDLKFAEEQIRATTGEMLGGGGTDGQQRGGPEGLRGEEPAERLQGTSSAGEVQDDRSEDRKRGDHTREAIPDGEEGRPDAEASSVTRDPAFRGPDPWRQS